MQTLTLGIGANASIFTLINVVLLKNLPVADPKMLVRVGDNTDCCVNSGAKDNGDYGLFSTEAFSQSLNKLQHSNLRLESKNRYIVHINPQAGFGST